MTNNTNTQTTALEPTTGYVCKECGQASPTGVGYTHTAPGAAEASAAILRCPCGYSIHAGRTLEPGTTVETVASLLRQADRDGSIVGVRQDNSQRWDITWTRNENGDWMIHVPTAPALGRPYETRSIEDWARALNVTSACGDVVVIAY